MQAGELDTQTAPGQQANVTPGKSWSGQFACRRHPAIVRVQRLLVCETRRNKKKEKKREKMMSLNTTLRGKKNPRLPSGLRLLLVAYGHVFLLGSDWR